jgi:hypothetical protein
MHISVDKPGLDDTRPWKFELVEVPPGQPEPYQNPTVRRGARGAAVKLLQERLGINADGIFGANTERTVRAFQSSRGLTADGVVGTYTWRELLKDVKPIVFYSQTGGYFSSTPFDESLHTSDRTNNPGALNAGNSADHWLRKLPGYVGDKITSYSGASANNTAIFQTPEDGVAAWWKLLERYAKARSSTIEKIITTYGGHGQDYSAYVNYVAKRLGLAKTAKVKLRGDDAALLAFAKAMFRYEAGHETKLRDSQILFGFKLARGETKRVVK